MVLFTPADAGQIAAYANFDFDTIKRWYERAVVEAWADGEQGFWPEYRDCLAFLIDTIKASLPKPPPVQVNGQKVSIADLKARHDIVAVIGGYVKLRKGGKHFSGKCPLHNGKTPSSLAVYPDSQSWYCFGCQRAGDVIDWIQQVEKTDFKGAAAILGASWK